MDLSAYRLKPLRKDGELILYRGVHQGPPDDLPLSVLVVAPSTDFVSPTTLARFEREYALAPQLDPRWAVRPVALVRNHARTLLVLDDADSEPLDRLGEPMEVESFLRVAIGIARAVAAVHEAGFIHKDIKPGNIVLTPGGTVRLTGFGIASRVPRERQAPEPPEFIAGTLAYMAPEQTGRMNRSIDSRSDLYALGVTFYQMLSGSLPFTADDPMEWIHCHIARKPTPLIERVDSVPTPLSTIIMKLIAKTAEERYQTAAGVEHDLRRCLLDWERHRRVESFALGQRDTADRLLIPDKLYGREHEVEALLATLDRVVTSGGPELVLVSGYSGIGKSSIAHELHKALVAPRALFASGKFDQHKRDIPYSTIAQAFQSLVRGLVAKSETHLAPWRDALKEALGPNGRLMVDLVPELELIIGTQPPVPELEPRQAKARFQLVIRRFIGAFARPAHPLVLFLDDLQWLDAATLDLLEDLLTRSGLQHLMLIGAYRDNEVDAAHPLARKLVAIKSAGGKLEEIRLAPLARVHLEQLIADAVGCEPARAARLAGLVHDKTAGNPFFAIQFLSALTNEGLLIFDHEAGCWSWDFERIHAKGYTDNVADLMMAKLARLPPETQKALQQLACLGNIAAIRALSLALGSSEEQAHAMLWPSVREELVERRGGAYKFVHDRVQEAAYSMVPEEHRAEVHLRIGRLLATHTPPEKRAEAIFDIVNQLNRGAGLIDMLDEREELAELNLIAGQRAKTSTAYASALKYLTTGAALLPKNPWERRPVVTFALELNRSECEFLTGALADAEQRLQALSTRAATTGERASVACLRIDLYTSLGQSRRAVTVALEYLRQAGIDWSPHPTAEDVRREHEHMRSHLGGQAIEDLIDLPLMADPAALATMDVLTRLKTPANFTDTNLYALAVLRAVSLSIERGNADGSCPAYVGYGIIACQRLDNPKAGFRFGQVGCELAERRGLKRFGARTNLAFATQLVPYARHLREGCDLIRRSIELAERGGDLTFAVYGQGDLSAHLFAAGAPLAEVECATESTLALAQNTGVTLVADVALARLGLIRTLRGITPRFGSLDTETSDEFGMERRLSDDPELAPVEYCYWIFKLQARLFAGDYSSALHAASRAEQLDTGALTLQFAPPDFRFFSALACAAACDSASLDARRRHLDAMAEHLRRLARWAQNCPENFENRAALVGAEIARIEGRELDAERLYEQAIRAARVNGFIQNEALAYELAAHFYAARGFERIARVYLHDARYCYLRWGAEGKARQLDELYPYLRQPEPFLVDAGRIAAPAGHLDLVTVISASQAVSGEIVLEKLIDTLLRTAIEHAGAERGGLLLPHGDELVIEAEANTIGGAVTVRLRETPLSAAELPKSVVRYVARTKEHVILDDASVPNPFSTDEYIRERRVRSVLCLPLVKQRALVAVLYLENNLAPNVFTPGRISLLKVLASAAAMSIENSQLYRELQARETRIRRLVDANIIGVLIGSIDGAIIDANDAFLDIVGYGREDLVARELPKGATPPEWHAPSQRALAELQATGRSRPQEEEYVRKDGSRVSVLVGRALFEDTPTRYIAFVVDITERKRAEEALQRVQTELAHVTRVMTLGELAASIAHEVNQPLHAIVAGAEACRNWLATGNPPLDIVGEALEAIVTDGHRAADIVQRIRELATKTEPRKVAVDLNDIVRDTVALVRGELHRHNVVLTLELASGPSPVLGDPVQLQQVILNLVVNGIESLAAVTHWPRKLALRCAPHEDGHIDVTVQDSGVGIVTTDLERIFSTFFSTKRNGMGMGLSISRSIIERHGGRLWAASNTGPGATFHVRLPMRSDAAPDS